MATRAHGRLTLVLAMAAALLFVPPAGASVLAQDQPGASDPPVRVSSGQATTTAVGQAVAVSQALFTDAGADYGVLARDDAFPDALGGSSLGFGVAPLLFTGSSGVLADATAAELRRVVRPGGTVYILGGVAAVPAGVDEELTAAGFQPRRLAGSGREVTAAVVADEVIVRHGRDGAPPLGTMILATAANWPDAVTAGQLGSIFGIPVLLTPPDQLAAATRESLTTHRPGTVLVAGGTAVVSDAVVAEVEQITGAGSTSRLAGPTRTGTGAAIADHTRMLLQQAQATPRFAVAVNLRRDDAFAHVLSASMLTGRLTGVFVPLEQSDAGAFLTGDVAASICQLDAALLVAGGPDLVDESAVTQVHGALRGTDCDPTPPTGGSTPPPPPSPTEGVAGLSQDYTPVFVGIVTSLPENAVATQGTLTYEAAVQASIAANGGQQLVTTGTVTQQPDGGITYDSQPADRLRAVLATGQVYEMFIAQMDGSFTSEDGTVFFNNPHVFDVRFTEPAVGTDLRLTSQLDNGQEAITVVGRVVDQGAGIDAEVDMGQQGTIAFGSSTGRTHEYELRGTVATDGLQGSVVLTRRFRLINDVITGQGGFATSWTVGGSTYELPDGEFDIRLRDGLPIEIDDWRYRATLLQDGTAVGGVELRPELDGLAAWFFGPGGETRLNSWGVTS